VNQLQIFKRLKWEEEIEQEVERVKTRLQRIIPTPIVNQLAHGTESFPFAVQSASVGSIQVSS
jgi:hypothetical protein